MYKKAIRMQLRVATPKGILSVEQLWGLSLSQLSQSIREVKKELKGESDDDLSFLDNTPTQANETIQLAFDILKDIYITKKSEIEAQKESVNKKAQLQELYAIKAERQKKAQLELTDEELEKQISELQM